MGRTDRSRAQRYLFGELTGGFLAGARRLPDVYCLEFAGQDDAFAVCEAESAAAGVEVVGAGLATARSISDRLRQLAFTRRASELVGTTDPTVESAATLLRSAPVERDSAVERSGSVERTESAERSGSVAVRAVDVRGTTGVDTQRAERVLGEILVDRGLTVDLDDPDHELRALFAGPPGIDGDPGESGGAGDSEEDRPRDGEGGGASGRGDTAETATGNAGGICALGWLTHTVERDFGDRKPSDRPFFQPGSMDPILARALVNVAGARPGATLLDPMCGTGGFLLEAALVGARVVGVDAQAKMVRGSRRNFRGLIPDATFAVCRGDARRLPLVEDAVDAAVVDVPYGRQSKIAADSLESLVSDALAEVRRVTPHAVVVGDRSWTAAAREAGWTVQRRFERRVHRSLVRHILVLDR